MRLGRVSLTSRLTPYTYGLEVQSNLVQRHVDYKALTSRHNIGASPLSETEFSPPDPIILTLQHTPTYTVGRRELGKIPLSQQQFLAADGRAVFYESPRGGQITYHAPGQLVAYPILDLRRHRLTPRCYIRLLENSVIGTMARLGIKGTVTENPGVWIPGGDRKVASVGVNVRRGITGHGVAINVEDRRGDLSWGFRRIVACGLEGKEVTWLEKEGGKSADGSQLQVEDVEDIFVDEFVKGLGGIDDVYHDEDLKRGIPC